MSDPKNKIQLFENQPVRVIWDEEQEKYWFSVVDIVAVLTEQPDYRVATKYWNTTKTRLLTEGSQLSTNCGQLKMQARDGKMRLTDVADTAQVLRIVHSIHPQQKSGAVQDVAGEGRQRAHRRNR